MTMEADLAALLGAVCPRVYPDFAPSDAGLPRVTYQALGGETRRFLEGSPASLRNTLMQISVWASTRAEALSLSRQIEDAICAATAFIAKPQGEPASTYEPDTGLRGAVQRFEIDSAR